MTDRAKLAEIDHEKLTAQTNVRYPDWVKEAVDRRMRERERETGLPLSRSLIIREILREWAASWLDARSHSGGES